MQSAGAGLETTARLTDAPLSGPIRPGLHGGE